MIITPPAKKIKGDEEDKKTVKAEQDWLKLLKNIPKDNCSINDPNVHPRLIHKDGSLCHSKTYWASLDKKPPLKEFELPDLFSDNEDAETQEGSTTKRIGSVSTENTVHPSDIVTKGNISENIDVNTENMTNSSKSDTPTCTDTDNVHTENTVNITTIANKDFTAINEPPKCDNDNIQMNEPSSSGSPVLINTENNQESEPNETRNEATNESTSDQTQET